MNQDVKAKWLTALRSGEYPQTENFLRTEDGFCCLGVLCEIAVKDGIIEESFPSDSERSKSYIYPDGDGVGEETHLPSKVIEWAGLPNENPMVTVPLALLNYAPDEDLDKLNIELSELNDAHEMPFSGIADLIEDQL